MTASGKLFRLLLSVALLSTTVTSVFGQSAFASTQITNRSLTLKDGATDGGSKAGGIVNHEFKFTVPTGGSVGSIKFQYCTVSVGVPVASDCTMPTGLVTNGGSTTLGFESGATGFTLNKTTNGAPYLTRTASSISASTVLTYRLTNITNPTADNTSFFVRISTYTSTDTTGAAIDAGVVTASTATQIVLTGIMPESLIFCTGGTISTNVGGIPDCSTATSGAIAFNQLFSPSDTATATSQLAASTNATFGYSISVFGPTLTSGSNTIPALTAGGVGVRGSGQFGMNLKANTTTTSTIATGIEVTPAPDGSNLRGQAATGYNTADSFKFVAGSGGNVIAASDNGGAGPTNAQIFTATYIVNVSGNQPSGTYTTTLTYIATSTF